MQRKKIHKLAAALAAVMMTAAGCASTDVPPEEVIPPMESAWEDSSETSDVTTVPENGDEVTESTKKTAPSAYETGDASDTEETSETEEEQTSWNETITTGVMYVLESCYATERPYSSATPVGTYSAGEKVEVIALTDSGYYKLKYGGYISSAYLTDVPFETEATVRTEATTVPETESSSEDTTKKTKPKKTETAAETRKTTHTDSDDDVSFDGDNDTASTTKKPKETTVVTTTTAAETTVSYTEALPSDGDYTKRYGYKKLTADEQTLYASIVSAVENLEKNVTIPSSIGRTDAIKVYTMVFDEESELFWMGDTVSVFGTSMEISYKTSSRSEINDMQAKLDASVSTVMAKVNSKSSTYEKLKVMYDYVVLNNDFCLDSSGYNVSVYNAFTSNGQLQCIGYAKAIQYLCDKAGIECMTVIGTNDENSSHAWNIVNCDGAYYNLDATWGDPINEYDSSYIRYTYFMVPDKWTHGISHYNINKMIRSDGSVIELFTPPACTSTAANYYSQSGLVFSDYDSAEKALQKQIDEAVANKTNVIEIRVTSDELFDQLTSNSAALGFKKYAQQQSSAVTSIRRHTNDKYKVMGSVYYDLVY